MLKLRKEHEDGLRQAYNDTFEDRLLQEIALRFHDQYLALGEPKTRQRIADAIAKAKDYEFTRQSEVASFVRLSFGLGSHFDTSSKLPFVREILQDSSRPASERFEEIRVKARQAGAKQPKA